MTKKISRQSECLHPLMLILFEYPFLKLFEYVFPVIILIGEYVAD